MYRRRAMVLLIATLLLIGLPGCTKPLATVQIAPPTVTVRPPNPPSLEPVAAPSQAVRDVTFLDENTGWVVLNAASDQPSANNHVDGPALASTSDGGKSWTDLGKIDFLPEGLTFTSTARGWAMGRSKGCQMPAAGECSLLIATTIDGGRSWERQWTKTAPASAGDSFGDHRLTFLNDRDGYLLFATGQEQGETLLTTIDGGTNWRPLVLPDQNLIDTATFGDRQRGWALGHRCQGTDCTYTIFATADGGRSWNPQMARHSRLLRMNGSFSFVDQAHGWLLMGAEPCGMHGCSGLLYRTEDGGQSWQNADWVETLQTENKEGGGSAVAIRFATAKDGWMLTQGGAASRGGIGVTRDGGTNWQRYMPDSDAHLVTRLAVVDAKIAWAVTTLFHGQGPVLYQTKDGGRTWASVAPEPAVVTGPCTTDDRFYQNLRIAAQARLPVSTTVITEITQSVAGIDGFVTQTGVEPNAEVIRPMVADGRWTFTVQDDRVLLTVAQRPALSEPADEVAAGWRYTFPRGALVQNPDLADLVAQFRSALSDRHAGVGAAQIKVVLPRPGPDQYLFYWGALDLGLFASRYLEYQECDTVSRGAVMAYQGGKFKESPAVMMNFGNGGHLGFGADKFVTQSVKSGINVTTWYDMPGLKLLDGILQGASPP